MRILSPEFNYFNQSHLADKFGNSSFFTKSSAVNNFLKEGDKLYLFANFHAFLIIIKKKNRNVKTSHPKRPFIELISGQITKEKVRMTYN